MRHLLKDKIGSLTSMITLSDMLGEVPSNRIIKPSRKWYLLRKVEKAPGHNRNARDVFLVFIK